MYNRNIWYSGNIQSSLSVNLTLLPSRFIVMNSISNLALPERIWLNPEYFDLNDFNAAIKFPEFNLV